VEIEKAIELLSDFCDRGAATLDDDFKEAVRIGKKALVHINTDESVRWDDESLYLLLGAERRKYEPDPRD